MAFDLFTQLKQETAFIHKTVMQGAWAKRILASDYTTAEYCNLLQRFYGFYQPLETRLLSFPATVFDPRRVKNDFIREDLICLTQSPPNADESCQRFPCTGDVPSALGVCYVLEGATLGGQIISKHLKRVLGLQAQSGLRFFEGYGSHTFHMWESFKSQCRLRIHSAQDRTIMLEAAKRTFSCFSEWMEVL